MEWEGEKIWLMVTKVKGGHVGAFFSNVVDACEERVKAMARDPAVQIYWKGYKRGVWVEDMNRLLNACFDVREVNKIPSSRYSKSKQMAVVGASSGVDMESMYKNSRLIDFTKGLTPDEKRDREVRLGIRFGEVKKGSPAAYNFNSTSSAKTATKGKRPKVGPKVVPEGESMAKSVFSLDPNTTKAEEINSEENSFDGESIETTESLDQEEALRRAEEEKLRADGVDNVTEDLSPMPPRTNLFDEVVDMPVAERIKKAAEEVKDLGGGNFPDADDLQGSERNVSDSSVESMSPAGERSAFNEEDGAAAESENLKSGDPDIEMNEIDPDEVENITGGTKDMALTEEQKEQREKEDSGYDWRIEEPGQLSHYLYNEFGPNKLNMMMGCSMIVDQVYDNKFINDAGFLSEDLFFSDIVSMELQEVLFDLFDDEHTKSEHYKEVMLEIMFEIFEELEDVNKVEGQLILDKTTNIEHENDKFFECSPGKTHDHGRPPSEAGVDSVNTPKVGADDKEGPASGQGHP